jgi:hypothetical protein
MDAFDHHKLQTLVALEAVCGFLPEDKVDAIIDYEIVHDHRYHDAALQMLMLRVLFIRDTLLGASLFSTPLDGIGKVEMAITYANSIDKIIRLPFVKEISVSVTGFLEPSMSIDETASPNIAAQIWSSLQSKMTDALQIKAENLSTDPKVNLQLLADRQARRDRAVATVNARVDEWSARTP